MYQILFILDFFDCIITVSHLIHFSKSHSAHSWLYLYLDLIYPCNMLFKASSYQLHRAPFFLVKTAAQKIYFQNNFKSPINMSWWIFKSNHYFSVVSQKISQQTRHLQIIQTHWFCNFKSSLVLGSRYTHFLLTLSSNLVLGALFVISSWSIFPSPAPTQTGNFLIIA